MKILITGASGFLGAALSRHLAAAGHRVIPLARGARRASGPAWNPEAGAIDLAPAGHIDAAIHLAGENIAAGRWTTARKARVLASRAQGTALLARALAAQSPKPAVFISASATGYYGDGGDALLDETSASGANFLAEVCRAWESAAIPAAAAGIRVVHPRIGIVLDPAGGALAKMLPPFRLGLGGPLGAGNQWMSWIAREDLCRALAFLLSATDISGPVNCVAPEPVTNRGFTRALGRVLHRPAFLPVPAAALRLLLGREMADALLLGGARVVPARLQAAGFQFHYPALEPAFRNLLAETRL